MAVNLIEALGQRGRLTGDKTTFIHVRLLLSNKNLDQLLAY